MTALNRQIFIRRVIYTKLQVTRTRVFFNHKSVNFQPFSSSPSHLKNFASQPKSVGSNVIRRRPKTSQSNQFIGSALKQQFESKEGYHDLGQRHDPILPSHILSRSWRFQPTEVGKKKSELIKLIRKTAKKESTSSEEWSLILNQISHLRPHLLPPDIAKILQSFAEVKYFNQNLLDDFSRSLIKFSDINSFLSSIVSLQRLEFPVNRLISSLLKKLKDNFDEFTFSDLRYLLIAFSTIFQNESTSLIAEQQFTESNRNDGNSQYESIQEDESSDHLFDKETTSDSLVYIKTQYRLFIRILYLMKIRILESEVVVSKTRIPRSRECPQRGRRNKQAVSPPLAIRGIIGLDSRDFFIIPFCLSRLGLYDGMILDKSMERLKPYIVSRLRTKPIDVLLAVEGFAFWASECFAGGQLCCENFRTSNNAQPISISVKREFLYSTAPLPLQWKFKTPNDSQPKCLPPGPIEATMKGKQFDKMAQRCATLATFLLEDLSTVELMQLGRTMQGRGIERSEAWNVWVSVLENSKTRLKEVPVEDLKTLIPLWRWLGRKTTTLQHLLAIEHHHHNNQKN